MRIATLLLGVVASLALAVFVHRQVVVEGEFGPTAMLGSTVLCVLAAALLGLSYLYGTRHRDIVNKLLLAGSVTVASYLIADIVAGWILIVPLSPPLVPDSYRHHALVPDSHAELRQRDFAYVQRVNHLGLRGRETTMSKPAGARRILMLGDSFTMGKGVEDNQTFSALVEDSLKAALLGCGGGEVEVLNGGVDSYAPILSYLQFKRELADLSPDLVVLNLDHSDLIQEAAYRQQAVRDLSGEIIAVPQVWRKSAYERFLSWTSRHLYFTRIALVHVNRAMNYGEVSVRRVVNEAGREHFAHTLRGDVDRTAQWEDVFESIRRIRDLAESLQADFLLATYPWAHQLGDKDWVPGRAAYMREGEQISDLTARTIRARSAALGIELFEALPDFQKFKGSEKLYFDYDPHWTPTGHQVMADGLGRYIAEHQLARWCAAR